MNGYFLVIWLLVGGTNLNTTIYGPYYTTTECEAAYTQANPNVSTLTVGATTASVAHMCIKSNVR